jgi:hypothetical protein
VLVVFGVTIIFMKNGYVREIKEKEKTEGYSTVSKLSLVLKTMEKIL